VRNLHPALLAIAVLGCGDNHAARPDAPLCPPPMPFPAGPLSDPMALPLPATCVAGGLAEATGRWVVADEDDGSIHGYPGFRAACGGAVERVGTRRGNGAMHATWSDDTRYVSRESRVVMIEGFPMIEQVAVFAACMEPDGRLAAVRGSGQITDGVELPESFNAMRGERFGPRGTPASGLALVGELSRRPGGDLVDALNVVVVDGFAYVVGYSGLDIVDVRVPAAPVHVGYVGPAFYNDVRMIQRGGRTYAFGANGTTGTTDVVDVTDPSTAAVVLAIDSFSHSLQLREGGGDAFLYLADGTTAIPVYDVGTPTTPTLIGAVDIPILTEDDGVHDLTVDGTMLYVNDTFGGTVAMDVSAGVDAEVEVGRFQPADPAYSHASAVGTAGGRAIVLTGDETWTGPVDGMAFMRVLDGEIGAPAFMTEIGRYQSRREVGIHNIELVGERAYLAYYHDGVRVVDLSTPTAPVEVAHYDTWDFENAYGEFAEGALGIRIVDGLIYVADLNRGLLILQEQ
jgi:hypothetical protein